MAEEKVIKETIKKLFDLLEIDGDFELNQEEEQISVILSTRDTGLVIGYHGEGLESLQLILSMAISKKIGRFIRVSLEIDGYKKNRTEWLEKLAIQTKERVLEENKEIALPNLKPWERRIVHMLLQDNEEVTSESIGEGRDRTLVVKPR